MKSIAYIDRETGTKQHEIVPGEGWLRWLYHNPVGKAALASVVKRKFLSRMYGRRMDKASSKKRIPSFVETLHINMDEAIRSIDAYGSFNEFFIRKLKPEARPVDKDPSVIVSPADGKVLAFEGLSGFDDFFVKGQKFCLDKFLRDEKLTEKYADGTLLIFRLAPVDYHRFHFPADGMISASTPIRGAYYSVSPHAVKDRLSVYWQNKREHSTLCTERVGDILMCEVGATMVGAIIQSYEPRAFVKKGQEKGYFKFGGSTVIMLLEKGKAEIDADILENTRKGFETSIKMGQHIATALDR